MAPAIKILQANLGRSRAAHDLAMRKGMKESNEDEEPNKKLTTKGWHRDKRDDVAVRFLNKQIQVAKVTAGAGYVEIELRDVTLFCCYLSPNARINQYTTDLDRMFVDIRRAGRKTILMGDLNAKSPAWGSPVMDARGEILGDLIASHDMVVINDCKLPTCVTPNGTSFIDVTAVTENLAGSVNDWKVHLEETLSTHRYIGFRITGLSGVGRGKKEKTPLDIRRCTEIIKEKEATADQCGNLEDLTTYLQDIRNTVARDRKTVIRRTPYWWTEEIEETWRRCNATRRAAIRARRTQHHQREHLQEEYKTAKILLKRQIRRSKRSCWRGLLETLDSDVWGEGYKLVMREFRGLTPSEVLAPETTKKILDELFPNRRDSWEPVAEEGTPPPPIFL